MSIMTCEKHEPWDSDFYEECPRCLADYMRSGGCMSPAANAVINRLIRERDRALDCLRRRLPAYHEKRRT